MNNYFLNVEKNFINYIENKTNFRVLIRGFFIQTNVMKPDPYGVKDDNFISSKTG